MPICAVQVDAARLEITLITDRRRSRQRLAAIVREAAEAGVDFVQVREKDLSARALLGLIRELLAATRACPTRLLVNGRPDVAVAAGAHGVQLPEAGLDIAAVRAAFPSLLIGASCHSLEAAARAERSGADFVVYGPVFPTPGKEGRAVGVAALAAVARQLRIPVHAVGGIDAGSVQAVAAAGARGVAAIRLFIETPAGQMARTLDRMRSTAARSTGSTR
jgi:thiamine-phosphate pyrophosphorylase